MYLKHNVTLHSLTVCVCVCSSDDTGWHGVGLCGVQCALWLLRILRCGGIQETQGSRGRILHRHHAGEQLGYFTYSATT